MANALDELIEDFDADEVFEALVFGDWGWGGFGEPEPAPVPQDKRGVLLTDLAEIRRYCEGWSFFGGYGAPDCYAVRVWTNKRIYWVTQYDGATNLDAAYRHPTPVKPDMPGG